MSDYHDPEHDEMPEPEKTKNAARYRWHEVWGMVLANPATETFERILDDTAATNRRAFRWIFLSGMVSYLISGILFVIATGWWELLPQLLLISVISGAITTLVFLLSSVFLQFFARNAGGEGAYDHFQYAYAASAAPLSVIRTLVLITARNPIFFLAVNLYQLLLVAMALRAVNKFSWGKTIVTMLAAFGAMGLLLMIPFFLFIAIVR
jgi:hypothetical protein